MKEVMREIKFRAWSPKLEVMLYDNEDIEIVAGNNTGYMLDSEPYGTQITPDYPIMQYTGLKDKNGVEIYEGDILLGRNTDDWTFPNYTTGEKAKKVFIKSVVEWDDKMSGWKPLNFYTTNGCNDFDDGFYEIESCEVIGNIYENKDLL